MPLNLSNQRVYDPNRPVGYESRKQYRQRIESGFWDRFIAGDRILDIGFRGGTGAGTIMAGAVGVEQGGFVHDANTPVEMQGYMQSGYDGFNLPFPTEFIDTVHSSHVLEHVSVELLTEWFRVLRIGGTMIIIVPHAYLYERRITVPPSRWSGEHLRSYTPFSLLGDIERLLTPNSYRVEHLRDVDEGYDYDLPSTVHPVGALEIECVIRKRETHAWSIDP